MRTPLHTLIAWDCMSCKSHVPVCHCSQKQVRRLRKQVVCCIQIIHRHEHAEDALKVAFLWMRGAESRCHSTESVVHVPK